MDPSFIGVTMRHSRLLLLPILAGLALLSCKKEEVTLQELRGIQIAQSDSSIFTGRERVANAMEFLHEYKFNAVFPVVWSDGGRLYSSRLADSLAGAPSNPLLLQDRDPLRETIQEAHQMGIAVIPKLDIALQGFSLDARGTLATAHPDWLDRESPERHPSRSKGERLSMLHPDVQALVLSLMCDVVQRYDLDGIEIGNRLVCLPIEGGYSEHTRKMYREEHLGTNPPADCRDPEWMRWRSERLNSFAERLAQEVKRLRPDIIIAWEVGVYPQSLDEHLQDWPAWIRSNSADLVIPVIESQGVEAYKKIRDSQSADSISVAMGPVLLCPGVTMKLGKSLIEADTLAALIASNRSAGYRGEVLMSYEDLRAKKDALPGMLVRKCYALPAKLPFAMSPPR
jgi:uncharacterized lipoprotein YddW (UPF0748 family)